MCLGVNVFRCGVRGARCEIQSSGLRHENLVNRYWLIGYWGFSFPPRRCSELVRKIKIPPQLRGGL